VDAGATGRAPDLTELCNLCGTAVADGSERYALARGSWTSHASPPQMDGQRLIVACGPDHLERLQQNYRQRPWSEEELWSGKLVRAAAGSVVSFATDALARAASLTVM
jgi:hypothetical protein